MELVNFGGCIWQKHGPRSPVVSLSAPGFSRSHSGERSLRHEMRYKNTVSGRVNSSSVMLPSSPRSAAEAFGWRNCEALLNLFLSYETQILERS